METPDTSHEDQARLRPSAAWIAAGAVALLVVGLLGYAVAGDPQGSLQVGSPVPDLRLTALDGTPLDLSAQRGKVVAINFFASWCDPCRQEAPDLEQVWRDYQDQGVQFYGIAYRDASSKAQSFLDEFQVTYPAGTDRGSRTARAYGVTGVPETFIVDEQGRLLRHILGPITEAELSQELDRALGQ